MHRPTLWRAVAVQTIAVAAISVALGLALPHAFFEDWGWLAGPGAWAGCALVTARVLRLPAVRTLAGAALAGVPSLLAVVIGVHWLGAAVAIVLFGLWCARLAVNSTSPPAGAPPRSRGETPSGAGTMVDGPEGEGHVGCEGRGPALAGLTE